MRLHAIVSDLETAKTAIEGGATVIQLRLKDLPTEELVDEGRPYRHLCSLHGVDFVVNDDVEAALELGADAVHLGQSDPGAERATAAGLPLGVSASTEPQAREAAERGALYVGAGPVWATPSKEDAEPPIGLEGLERMRAVPVSLIAIGGVDASNAADCIRAGADGVAVIRAARDARRLRAAIDEALGAR
ncbi:MAG TPA: thiamine phosphate synthase [Gaiellaceae bacterium]|jgi:thiamine-phosphate pyrophosphorylase|nr:thiamine phosphate synthase [Gaiellaceae bacterium]